MNSDSSSAPVIPLGQYRHYKGHDYIVHHLARHSETEAWFVVYSSAKQPDQWWIRPLTMFCEEILWPDGISRPRFSFIG